METLIDAHLHIHPMPSEAPAGDLFAPGAEGTGLLPFMDTARIAKAHVHLLYEQNRVLPVPSSPRLVFSMLIDFRRPDAEAAVAEAAARGYRGIKFLTFEQKIMLADYPRVHAVARAAEQAGLFITICATHGGLEMFDVDPLRLAAFLLHQGIQVPLVLAHAGGSRVREAMLLMDASKSVYLDTSFTTTFWKGSPVMPELRYVLERFPDRVMFGSDHPAVPFSTAVADARAMAEGVAPAVWEAYLHGNAEKFFFV
ncbi:MAG: hypothetical protein RL141_917 [Candidatus Parcubacteria bacterium]|jgi:predicted TIM-barrel fold metal-dependent hydrolase